MTTPTNTLLANRNLLAWQSNATVGTECVARWATSAGQFDARATVVKVNAKTFVVVTSEPCREFPAGTRMTLPGMLATGWNWNNTVMGADLAIALGRAA